jgi:hypothetical protein
MGRKFFLCRMRSAATAENPYQYKPLNNSRDIKDNERFELSLKNSEGRLKYMQLIGK